MDRPPGQLLRARAPRVHMRPHERWDERSGGHQNNFLIVSRRAARAKSAPSDGRSSEDNSIHNDESRCRTFCCARSVATAGGFGNVAADCAALSHVLKPSRSKSVLRRIEIAARAI